MLTRPNNVRYAGKIPNPVTGGLITGSYPAMITIDEYNKAQYILGKRGKPHMIDKKEFAYKGVAVCGECGCSIVKVVFKFADEHKALTAFIAENSQQRDDARLVAL